MARLLRSAAGGFFVILALPGPAAGGEKIAVPLYGGNIIINFSHFITRDEFADFVRELWFSAQNQTSRRLWQPIKLQFTIGGLCNGEPRQWNLPVSVTMTDGLTVDDYRDTVISLVGLVDGCTTEIVRVSLVSADGVAGPVGERIDLMGQLQEIKARHESEAAIQADKERLKAEAQAEKDEAAAAQLREIQAKREAEVAIQAEKDRLAAEAQREEDRLAAEAQTKKDMAAAARKKQALDEMKRQQAEAAAISAKNERDKIAREAELRRELWALCTTLYKNTADKKVSDLTVREASQVKVCEGVGAYHP
jgi:hypothetical protein